MQNYLKRQIMESRHQILYGENNEARLNILKELESEYPIVMDRNAPMAIYLEDYGLPKIENASLDADRMSHISWGYLICSFLLNIANKILEQGSLEGVSLQNVMRLLNYTKPKNYPTITNLEDIVAALSCTKTGWLETYYGLSEGKEPSLDKIPFFYIGIEHILMYLKEALRNESHFVMLINHTKDITLASQQAINGLIGARINKDLGVKLAMMPGEWQTYRDARGQLIEYVHDYGIVELDDSYKKHIRELKKKQDTATE